MKAQPDITARLNEIDNWVLVSYKKKVLKGLKKLIRNNERIIGLLDGIYRGMKISDRGKELPGVLFITDRRLLFITSEEPSPLYEEIPLGDIQEIIREKAFSSLDLRIRLKSASVLFKTFADTKSVNDFLDQIHTTSETPAVSHDERSLDLLNEMAGAFTQLIEKSSEAINEKNDTHQKTVLDDTEKSPDDLIDDMERLNFLFTQGKRLYGIFTELSTIEGLPDFKTTLMNDIIILSSLCAYADGYISPYEKIFISLILMPFNPEESAEIEKTVKELFSFDSFPLHFRESILEYHIALTRYIKKARPGIDLEGATLKSLNLLSACDRENGTRYTDRAGTAFYTYSQCLMKADGGMSQAEEERLDRIHHLITRVSTLLSDDEMSGKPEKQLTLEEVMEKIDALVDMTEIKEQIQTFVNLIKVQKERKERGLPVTPLSLHSVFYGPPGTGKTTIARLIAQVYRALGLLKKGHLVETDRAGLVAGYVGQTALNVDKVVNRALDGVLFIDEAYSLVPEEGGKDFGQEAIDIILKRMEDYRERLVVIVAGYTDEMKHFIDSNPGLKSRFSRYFYFDHYTPDELAQIFDIFSNNVEFTVDKNARAKLTGLLSRLYEKRNKSFGNGRLVRNIFERVIELQANRIAGITPLTNEVLCTVTEDDVPDESELRV